MQNEIESTLLDLLEYDFREKLNFLSLYLVVPITVFYIPVDYICFHRIFIILLPFRIFLIFAAIAVPRFTTNNGRKNIFLFYVLAISYTVLVSLFALFDNGLSSMYGLSGMASIFLGSGIFLPWPKVWETAVIVVVEFIIYITIGSFGSEAWSWEILSAQIGFFLCFVLMGVSLNDQYRKIRRQELVSRLDLQNEVKGRDRVIRSKIQEIRAAEGEIAAKNRELEISQKLSDLAAQVAHDIRSPLTGLGMATYEVEVLDEDRKKLIKSSIARINDIANNLLTYKKNLHRKIEKNNESEKVLAIGPFIDQIVSEKRFEIKNSHNIQLTYAQNENQFGIFVSIKNVELGRVISNILNNAIEAISDDGLIGVTLESDDKIVSIKIIDNGKGIPSSIISRLGEKGFSYQKANGHGLGLYHAEKLMESIGGQLKISSTENQFTEIRLDIPQAAPPAWFADKIALKPQNKVIIVDDDSPVMEMWKSRLPKTEIEYLTNPSQLKEYLNNGRKDDDLFLVDYQFQNTSESGLSVVHKNQLQDCAILVTSRFEDSEILIAAEKIGLKILPKNWIPFVPIEIR